MFRRVICSACGERGIILADEAQVWRPCTACGQPLEPGSLLYEGPAQEEPTIDDIVSWLSPTDTPRPSEAVTACICCGRDHMMFFESDLGELICPECLAVHREPPDEIREKIECPECFNSMELHESDRGKTIVCPACNYFLGCMLLPEKRRFVALPFLNALLGSATD